MGESAARSETGIENSDTPPASAGAESDRTALTIAHLLKPHYRSLAAGLLAVAGGGLADLAGATLRAVSPHALADDPLRVLRLVRLSVTAGLRADAATRGAALANAPLLREVAAERVFAELRGVLSADEVVRGVDEMDELGVTAAVLPEL